MAPARAPPRVRVAGVWQHDRPFGAQVKVAATEPLAPAGDAVASWNALRSTRALHLLLGPAALEAELAEQVRQLAGSKPRLAPPPRGSWSPPSRCPSPG